MRDEVDELRRGLGAASAPTSTSAPVEVFSRVSRLARHLDLARRDAFAAHGIEPWEFDVLAALRRAGAPYELSPGRLLRETLVTSGTMTNRVDRLGARGLVERSPDPDDRRGVIVRLTAEGKATVDAAFAALLEAERELLADLPERDRPSSRPCSALLAPFTPRRPSLRGLRTGRRVEEGPARTRCAARAERYSRTSAASSHSSSSDVPLGRGLAQRAATSSVSRSWSAAWVSTSAFSSVSRTATRSSRFSIRASVLRAARSSALPDARRSPSRHLTTRRDFHVPSRRLGEICRLFAPTRRSRYSSTPAGSIEIWPSPSSAAGRRR